MESVDLSKVGISVSHIIRNPAVSSLYEDAIRSEPGTAISNRGALIAYSGAKTGRSPTDNRVVKDELSDSSVWWGNVNIPIEPQVFEINRDRAVDYLNTREKLFCIDGYAGWDPRYRIKVRVICARAYHALFMWNMLIRPTGDDLKSFGEPDCVILNAGAFPAKIRVARI